jgi:hypothetical protein
MRASGTVAETSARRPEDKNAMTCPGCTCSFTSTRTSEIAPSTGAVRIVYSSFIRASASFCSAEVTAASAASDPARAASRSARAAFRFSQSCWTRS